MKSFAVAVTVHCFRGGINPDVKMKIFFREHPVAEMETKQ